MSHVTLSIEHKPSSLGLVIHCVSLTTTQLLLRYFFMSLLAYSIRQSTLRFSARSIARVGRAVATPSNYETANVIKPTASRAMHIQSIPMCMSTVIKRGDIY